MSDIDRYFEGTELERDCGSCSAVRIGERIQANGVYPIDQWGHHTKASDIFEQARFAFQSFNAKVERMGILKYEVLSIRAYVTEPENFTQVSRAIVEFAGDKRPTVVFVPVACHIVPQSKVAFDIEINF